MVEAKPTPQRLLEETLAEYATSFVMGGLGDLFTFTPQEGGLSMNETAGDHSAITEIPPEPEPPSHCLSFGSDRFVFIEGPMKDSRVNSCGTKTAAFPGSAWADKCCRKEDCK